MADDAMGKGLVMTVGELKRALEGMTDSLPVRVGYSDSGPARYCGIRIDNFGDRKCFFIPDLETDKLHPVFGDDSDDQA
jgi:hypothetical protein